MDAEKMMCVLEGTCPDCVIENDPFGVDLGIIRVGGTVKALSRAYPTIQDFLAMWTSSTDWYAAKRQFERLQLVYGPGGGMVIEAPCEDVNVWRDPVGGCSVMLIQYGCPKCKRTYECYMNHVGDWDVVEGMRMEVAS